MAISRAKSVPLHVLQKRNQPENNNRRKAKSVGASPGWLSLSRNIQTILDNIEEVSSGSILVLGKEGVGKTSLTRRLVYGQYVDTYKPTTSEETHSMFAMIELKAPAAPASRTRRVSLAARRMTQKVTRRSRSSTIKTDGDVLAWDEIDGLVATGTHQFGLNTTIADGTLPDLRLLRKLEMSFVDPPPEVKEHSPLAYQAGISNAYAFLIVISIDDSSSLDVAQEFCSDVKRARSDIMPPVIIVVNKTDLPCDDYTISEVDIEQLISSTKATRVNISCATGTGIEHLLLKMTFLFSAFNNNRAVDLEENVPDDYVFIAEKDRKQRIDTSECILM